MTTPIMPARKWGDEPEPEPVVPVVLVSSRDGAPVPVVAGAVKLAAVAAAHGWSVTQTYAHAELDDQWWKNGKLRKPAHDVESVAVRMSRLTARGFAVWHSINGGPWLFEIAYIDIGSPRGWKGAGSILAAVCEAPS